MKLGAQDSPSSRITSRFVAIDEGLTVKSLTGTYRSMRGQSFPGMKRSLDLFWLSLK